MRVLRARLYEQELERQRAELDATRRSQIGTGDRSEKIRTYNFPENRVTDHRIGLTKHQLDRILQGDLDGVHRRAGHRGPAARARGVTVSEALALAEERLAAAGVETPRVDAELLLAHLLGDDSHRACTSSWTQSSSRVGRSCSSAAERREPLAYVLGEWGFRRLTLKVDSRVLVPRPETEVVVERCLGADRRHRNASGPRRRGRAPARSRSRSRTSTPARVTAIDSSAEALEVAEANAEAAGLAERVRFRRTRSHEGLALGEFDLVVSNPPYIRPDEISSSSQRCGTGSRAARWSARSRRAGRGRGALGAPPEGWLVLETAAGPPEGSPSASSCWATGRVRPPSRPERASTASWRDGGLKALLAGEPVVLPTDTVYGLCALPARGRGRGSRRLRARRMTQPISLLFGDLDGLLVRAPGLEGRPELVLLPGPYTLVFPNPERAFRWLTGSRPDTIGVRVPELRGEALAAVVEAAVVAATSANLHGGPDPRRLEDVRRRSAGCRRAARRRRAARHALDRDRLRRRRAARAARGQPRPPRRPSGASARRLGSKRGRRAGRRSSTSAPPGSPRSTPTSPSCSAASSSGSATRSS